MSSQVDPQMDAAGKRAGGRMSAGMKAGLIAGAAAVGVAAAKFIGDSIAEAQESAKIGAVTTQLIKNQGAAATVSAAQVGKLATAISNKTGVDDEAIQSGQNLLLSFQSVQNQAGKGNAIFDRASQAIVDLGTKMGSPEAAAKVLGKALNDPEKGMTALTRAGVPLTKSQQEQVKAFMKSGDTLSAQRIILDAVEKKMGGVAAASSTGAEKMATAWGNFKESIGAKFLPVVEAVTAALTPLIQKITSSPAAMTAFAVVLGGAVAGAFVAAAVAAWAFVAPLLVMALPFILIGIAIAALIAGIVLLVKNWDTLKAKMAAVWDSIKAKTMSVWNSIKSFLVGVWNGLKSAVSSAWDGIKSAVTSKANAVLDFVKSIPSKIAGFFKSLPGQMKSIGGDIVDGLSAGISGAWHFVTDKVKSLIAKIPLAIRKLMGIASPSKVMAREVGRWIPAGIAVGIDKNAGVLRSSMASLTSDMSLTGGATRIHASVGASSSAADRPIYTESGVLFGMLRQIANGEVRLVLNEAAFDASMGATV